MAVETFVVESTLSPEDAFDKMIDLTRVPEWDRGIRDSLLIEGELGSVGARYQLDLKGFDGEPTTAVYEVTSVDGNQAFAMVGANADFRAEDAVSIEAADDGCRVTYVAGLTLLGENPPVTNAQLTVLFPKVVAVAEAGITLFLNP